MCHSGFLWSQCNLFSGRIRSCLFLSDRIQRHSQGWHSWSFTRMCENSSKMWTVKPAKYLPSRPILCSRTVLARLFWRHWMCFRWKMCEFNVYENMFLWCSLFGWWILWKRRCKWRITGSNGVCLAGKLNWFTHKCVFILNTLIVLPGCRRDTNCPFGQVCNIDEGTGHRGKCEPGCHFNNDCTMGTACINGNCTDPCIGFDECGANAVCETVSHSATCKCPNGTRELNSPYVACVPADMDLSTISCLRDTDCSFGLTCQEWQCRPAGTKRGLRRKRIRRSSHDFYRRWSTSQFQQCCENFNKNCFYRHVTSTTTTTHVKRP